MPDYRRARVPGGTFFFTVVTAERRPILTTDLGMCCLREAIRACRAILPFRFDAYVILPDHLHAIWTLPDGDADFSTRWGQIKRGFTIRWREAGASEATVTAAQAKGRRAGIWQRQFWEHCLSDEDYENHFNYLHYNPVKHGLTRSPVDWPWSSFHRWVDRGVYEHAWGAEPSVARAFEGLTTVGE